MSEVPREGPDPLILENLVGGIGICTSGEVTASENNAFSLKSNTELLWDS